MNMRIEEEIQYYAEILGRENPAVHKALLRLSANPKEAGSVRDQFMLMLERAGYDVTDLPVFPVSIVQNQTEGVFLGQAVLGNRTGGEIVLSIKCLATPTLIAGITGSGKTTLMMWLAEQLQKDGIRLVFFDCQDEYKKLLKVFPEGTLLVMSPEEDKDNPLEPPPYVSIEEWKSRVIDWLRESLYLRDGSCNLLRTVLDNVYGVADRSDQEERRVPTIKDVITALEAMEFKAGSRQAGYLETLLNRFKNLGPLLKTFDCEKGYPLEKILQYSVVYRLGSLSDDHRLLYTNLKLMKFCAYREKQGEFSEPEFLFVIEEAHVYTSPKLEMRADLGEPYIFTLARTIRKRGASIILIEQVPASLPYQILGNINTKIVLRLGDVRSIEKLADSMVLNPMQAEKIPVLPFRHGIFRSPENPNPVLFQIPEIHYEVVSEEEVRKSNEKILATLEFVPARQDEMKIEVVDPAENKEKRGWVSVKDPHKELMEDVKTHPFDGINERRERLGDWNPWYIGKIVQELEQIGFIKKPISISLGGRGNPKKMLQLSEKGAKFMGIDYDTLELKGKGSDEHKFLQNIGAEKLKSSGKNAFVEYCSNGKSADIVVLADDGEYHAFEIELDSTNPHVIQNVKLDLQFFATCTIISRNMQAQNEIKKKVYSEISYEEYPRVRFELLREFLSE